MLKTSFAAYLLIGLAAAFTAVAQTPEVAEPAVGEVAEEAIEAVVEETIVEQPAVEQPAPAEAPLAESVMVESPAEPEPTPLTEYRDAVVVEEVWDDEAVVHEGVAVECCPIDVTSHRVRRSAKDLFACQDVIPVTLCVENPADCCLYSVTLCVPCCCIDEARLCDADRGFLGRGKVEYAWNCGLCAEIVFRARGDVVVNYTM